MTKISKEPQAAQPACAPLDAAAIDGLLGALASLNAAAADVLAATTRRDPVFQQLGAAIDTATAARSAFEAALAAAQPAGGDAAVRSEDATVSFEAPQ